MTHHNGFDWGSVPIAASGLSARTVDALGKGGVETLGQAAELSEGQLLALDRLGRGSLQEIKDAVRRAVSGKPPAKSLLEVIAEEDSAARAPGSPA